MFSITTITHYAYIPYNIVYYNKGMHKYIIIYLCFIIILQSIYNIPTMERVLKFQISLENESYR